MSQIPNYFARQPVSRLSPTTTPTTKQQGRFGDAVDAFQAGGLSAVGGIFDFVGADHLIRIPKIDQLLQPVLAVVPLQVIAYEMAVARGNDVDQPRNLAKSVTVE